MMVDGVDDLMTIEWVDLLFELLTTTLTRQAALAAVVIYATCNFFSQISCKLHWTGMTTPSMHYNATNEEFRREYKYQNQQ